METAYASGKMALSTTVSMSTATSKAKAGLFMLPRRYTMVNGEMESKKARALYSILRELSFTEDIGEKESL